MRRIHLILPSRLSWTTTRVSRTNICQRFLCSEKKNTGDVEVRPDSSAKGTPQTGDVAPGASSPSDAAATKSQHRVDSTDSPARADASSHFSKDIKAPFSFSSYASTAHAGHTPPPSSTSSPAPHLPPAAGPAAGHPAADHPAGSSRVWNYTASVNNSLKDIEQSLMNRIHESNKRRFRVMFFGSLGALVWFFVVFGGTIGSKLKSMTTGLALETLEDKSIKIQTEELARAVVQTVLNDKEVTAQAASFLREASHAPETQEALLKLTLHVLQHPDSLKELTLLTKNVLASLSSDAEAVRHLAALFSAVFQDPELKQHLSVVASEICKSPEVMAAAAELTAQVFQEPVVQEAVNCILVEGSGNVMKNEEISVQARQFVAEVMGDDSLQREGGNALWNSIYHAIVPGAIRITGFSLICLSLGLGGLMLSPY